MYQELIEKNIEETTIVLPSEKKMTHMQTVQEFYSQFTEEERKKMVQKQTTGDVDKTMKNFKLVFVHNVARSRSEPIELKKQKFIVPADITLMQLKVYIRAQMVRPMQANQSIHMVYDPLSVSVPANDDSKTKSTAPTIFPISWTIGEVYRMYHNPKDGILYLGILQEDTFGNGNDHVSEKVSAEL